MKKDRHQLYQNKFSILLELVYPARPWDESELVELSFKRNNVEDFAVCDGFVFAGGVDIDPLFTGKTGIMPMDPKVSNPREISLKKKYTAMHNRTNSLYWAFAGVCNW